MAAGDRKYSCESAAETREWMNAIADFLRPFKPLVDAHVVNFFKGRLWELVDEQWMACLRKESVENLLNLPSGVIQDYWPLSLQEFVRNLTSLVLPREQELSHPIFPNLRVSSLGSVLTQGMNMKKKHEVEILAAATNAIASGVGAQKIIDVGSGQGYLAQALSFHYQLVVIAIDASLHHADVTNARAERIKKHYAAKLRKSQQGNVHMKVPQTVTCHVLSSETLTTMSSTSSDKEYVKQSSDGSGKSTEINALESSKAGRGSTLCNQVTPLVLVGLHSCGDLSVNMLRSFVECEQVKALICIGCCYNLLSEECSMKFDVPCGFPLSNFAKPAGMKLGKNARDLACQSAERWKCLTKDAALQNFDLHAFRAAFQMVLDKHYPETLKLSPTIGRQGKALRRRLLRRNLASQLDVKEVDCSAITPEMAFQGKKSSLAQNSSEVEVINHLHNHLVPEDGPCTMSGHGQSSQSCACYNNKCDFICSSAKAHKDVLFEEFVKSGLDHLGFSLAQNINVFEIWKEIRPYTELVGPFWSLRASLGPLIETYILLDRLLFLQEQGESVQAFLIPLFHPTISPRNMAIVAWKTGSDTMWT
ncbi:protein RRNAD1 isoform X1 [Dioscorea cayenensis subsp. rotundata]|uniref:Protein RRNAD1 isoform X1 n=1 Tax=Dioscorea cayennensis subsp. rotundata TaxID=55577 RepID=A0AB40BS52_DIOCR|nr:protein RRNAD1 isoform X1 [Dioscorea cayenensis subsp. rotundata]XP_039130286.1 protein RRNAD1 isoform X1 [Dioscorea cayenensis subsp. rotundata]XP_039130287.1 protein RRNAD1 isoform X1 [Dioscorea cayenensis subsp. rotundata]XP_039130288.1 protein RRNAD1 isoform X1 [Dioscorea cayenensis subsp. rotundata]